MYSEKVDSYVLIPGHKTYREFSRSVFSMEQISLCGGWESDQEPLEVTVINTSNVCLPFGLKTILAGLTGPMVELNR